MNYLQDQLKRRAHELIDTLPMDDWSLLARLEELRFMHSVIKASGGDEDGDAVPSDNSNS